VKDGCDWEVEVAEKGEGAAQPAEPAPEPVEAR